MLVVYLDDISRSLPACVVIRPSDDFLGGHEADKMISTSPVELPRTLLRGLTVRKWEGNLMLDRRQESRQSRVTAWHALKVLWIV